MHCSLIQFDVIGVDPAAAGLTSRVVDLIDATGERLSPYAHFSVTEHENRRRGCTFITCGTDRIEQQGVSFNPPFIAIRQDTSCELTVVESSASLVTLTSAS